MDKFLYGSIPCPDILLTIPIKLDKQNVFKKPVFCLFERSSEKEREGGRERDRPSAASALFPWLAATA